ncbi:MAG: acyl-ACP thioesterase domain-containing protein [Rhodothermales bacterium]
MTAEVWSETFRVRSYESDPSGRASIQTICNYLQEAAGNHAGRLGVAVDQLTQKHMTWVLARLRVEMDGYPAWRDEVIVETWPSGHDGLYAMREFVVKGPAGAVARASSAWLLIDLERRRPMRIPDFIANIELPDRHRPVSEMPSRLPEPTRTDTTLQFPVQYADLDVNRHVNNVRFVEWSLEALPAGFLESHSLATLDVHFRAEANLGDSIGVEVGELAPLDYAHLVRSGDRELARSRTTWRDR